MSINYIGEPSRMPVGRTLVELATEANKHARNTAEGEAKLAEFMGLVIIRPGHPARPEVLAYLTQYGRGAMLGLIPVIASATIH
ncbi:MULTISPECIES: hypothetical protein [unclassified Caballeronia]|uniref:hypothetical protein n=1 Tax=unclassified Caballeronia TaxID=2646786 RepID=UPI001F419D31|nr:MULTISPECIES: hypothetical protein [unclassified Caballeronia]MCE4542121.1 hypothetical protein [Caballeronia sp. PC1]MCE4568833.1 hypothetical protein [Caballeronia sp. CLC5]